MTDDRIADEIWRLLGKFDCPRREEVIGGLLLANDEAWWGPEQRARILGSLK